MSDVAPVLLDVDQVAARLGTRPRFVRRLIAERRTEFHKLGRHVRISQPALAVFTSAGGGPLRRSNFCRRIWRPALRAAGLPLIHFHDLRHTGNQLAADAGANLRELMDRMGQGFRTGAPTATRTRDLLLRRSWARAPRPVFPQVSVADGLSAGDREIPRVTGRSGTQRARGPRS